MDYYHFLSDNIYELFVDATCWFPAKISGFTFNFNSKSSLASSVVVGVMTFFGIFGTITTGTFVTSCTLGMIATGTFVTDCTLGMITTGFLTFSCIFGTIFVFFPRRVLVVDYSRPLLPNLPFLLVLHLDNNLLVSFQFLIVHGLSSSYS